MLANRIKLNQLLRNATSLNVTPVATHATGGFFDERYPIGKREWVGYGYNGGLNYQDRSDFPMPAVRFKEIKGDLVALKEKEKGDWKKLTLEEKKALYRASFRQTLAETDAPTGKLKSVFGIVLVIVSLGITSFALQKMFIYRPKPHTFTEEYRAQTLRRIIDLKHGNIYGPSSKWDYEKNDWKH